MLSGEERKKLYAEIESYRQRVVEARKNLNIADKQKEEWFDKKEQVGKEITGTITKITTLRKKRDELTKNVKELKEQRRRYGDFIKNKVFEFKNLDKERKKISDKYKIKTNPARIKEEIAKLEEKLETEALEFNKEKKLMVVINSKKKQLDEASELMDVLRKTKNLSKEIDELKNRADGSHNKIQNVAKNSQEIHLQMMGFSRQVDELKKEKKSAYKKFFEFKKRFSKLNGMLKENLMKMNLFSKKNRSEKNKIKERKEQKKDRLIEGKRKEVQEKMKKGKKLTTEDILVMQEELGREDK